uniref:Uncharacterized protein n=1 Tax=Ciona intestinalis TaxID=7719 RepID=H2XKJ9_CIOIN
IFFTKNVKVKASTSIEIEFDKFFAKKKEF